MTNYQHLRCESIEMIPSLPVLGQMAQGDSVTLEFPPDVLTMHPLLDIPALSDQLRGQLPDHSIRQGSDNPDGLVRISIMRVISRAEVLAERPALLEAMHSFRKPAQLLMNRLAQQLGVPLSAFWGPPVFTAWWVRAGRPRMLLSGLLDNEWRYTFHGAHCRFIHETTGQELEVAYVYPEEFGVLDPYFFFKYLNTTPSYHHLGRIFIDPYADPLRALEILTELGDVRRLSLNGFLPVKPG